MPYTDKVSNDLLQDYCSVSKKLIVNLKDIKNTIVKKHHRDCRISSTVGSSVGAIGSGLVIAGIALSITTAGLSSILTIVGLTVGVLGAGTGFGTVIADGVISKKMMKNIELLMEERNKLAISLEEFFQFIQDYVDIYDEDGTGFAFKLGKAGVSTGTKIYQLIKTIREAVLGIETAANVSVLKGFFILRIIKLSTIGQTIIVAGKTGVQVTVKTISLLGIGIGVISAFTVIDLAMTIKSWSKSNIHPVEQNIDEIIKQLKQSTRICKDMLKVMDSQEIKLNKKIVIEAC